MIGRTDKAGVEVADRPATVPDAFATFCRSLGIAPSALNLESSSWPIDPVAGGTAVAELFAG